MRGCRSLLSFSCIISLFLVADAQARDVIVAGESAQETRQILQRAIESAEPGSELELAAGIYEFDAPLRISRSIALLAKGDSKVFFSGGRRLVLKWKQHAKGFMQARIPESLNLELVACDQLYLNGTRLHLARYPNHSAEARFFGGTAADAISLERTNEWANPSGGFIHSLHRSKWGGNHWQILGKNADGTLKLEGGWMNNRPSGINPKLRFVENIREELDAPGEWYLDRESRTLYVYPPQGVSMSDADVVVSGIERLVEVIGTSPDEPAAGVRLEGIEFAHTARTFMQTNEPLLRSDWMIHRGGAVYIENARNVDIQDCDFHALGGNGVFVSGFAEDVAVAGCHLSDIGASGVCFVGKPAAVRSPAFNYRKFVPLDQLDREPGPKAEDYPRDCIVEDCLVHDIGTTEKQVAGVQIAMAARITVRHVSIYDTPRAGINIGDGTWGGHRIEGCDVFDTVQMTGDHGSFNSWGRDRFWHPKRQEMDKLTDEHPELILLDAAETTVICNSRWRCDHGWDIDLDDGSSNYEIYNNLCLNGGIKLREGFHRHVYNNIMINNSFHPHVWFKESHDSFERNIVTTWYRPIRLNGWGERVDNNLLPDVASLDRSRELGLDGHGKSGDPMFVDPEAGDFRVKAGSPALDLQFENFSMDEFGVRKLSLREIAREPVIPKLKSSAETSSARQRIVLGATVKKLRGLEERSATGLGEDRGLLVLKVPEGSVARAVGLRENDVLLRVGDRKINQLSQFQPAYLQTAADQQCEFTIFRDQREQTLSVPGLLSIRLNAESAKLAGKGRLPRYDAERDFLGYWTNENAAVTWNLDCRGMGTFEVYAELAAPAEAKGAAWTLAVGDQKLSGVTPSTGGWGNFRRVNIGSLDLDANGKLHCELVPLEIPGEAVMNLRAVELVRQP